MNQTFSKTFTLSLLCTINLSASAQNIQDTTSPYINPQRDCMTEGMINPEGKEYRYLFSKDCRVVHVLPPAKMDQDIKTETMNLNGCDGVSAAQKTLNSQAGLVDLMQDELMKIEVQLSKSTNANDEKRLREKADRVAKKLAEYSKVYQDSVQNFEKNYGKTPGAKFSIYMNGDITHSELNGIRALNLANLRQQRTIERHTVGPDGAPKVEREVIYDTSTLRTAQIDNSIYSFIYDIPDTRIKNGGVIYSNIPGLQHLEQPGAEKGVIHVKASGGISGEVYMSLPAICPNTKKTNGKYQLDQAKDPFFTVNRTFYVQQMFAQGYQATLNVKKVVDEVAKSVTRSTEGNFQKSNVFAQTFDGDFENIMEFVWVSDFENGKGADFKAIREIKGQVAATLIDDYISKLVSAGVLNIQKTPTTERAQGGHVDETRVANRCWTEKDGGLSGLLGRRHQVCADYTYSVKVWRDGITEDDIRKSLTLDGQTKDSMSVNMMAPFYFTTAFRN